MKIFPRQSGIPLLLTLLAAGAGCAQYNEATHNMELARTKGKYQVRLTQDVEGVEGKCQFVRMFAPDSDPVAPPTEAELPDWLRTQAAYYGADTVIVRGRIGDAYICGPGPLNPDGTRNTGFPSPAPQPTPTPPKS
jgi:hypothetical protein